MSGVVGAAQAAFEEHYRGTLNLTQATWREGYTETRTQQSWEGWLACWTLARGGAQAEVPQTPELGGRLEAILLQLRRAGWEVVAHNDVRLCQELGEFWLFIHPSGRIAQGLGRNATEALEQVWLSAGSPASTDSIDVRSIEVECNSGIDILDSLYGAAGWLPICPLLSVVAGAIQEIQHLREAAAPAAVPAGLQGPALLPVEDRVWPPGQPISTVPRDGSWILVADPDSPMAWAPFEFAYWDSEYSVLRSEDTSEESGGVFWWPLPNFSADSTPAVPEPSAVSETVPSAGTQDSDRLDWLQEAARRSQTGISFDWIPSVEGARSGFRFMRRFFVGDARETLRSAIDSARAEVDQMSVTTDQMSREHR